jgi:hypothetical protein
VLISKIHGLGIDMGITQQKKIEENHKHNFFFLKKLMSNNEIGKEKNMSTHNNFSNP